MKLLSQNYLKCPGQTREPEQKSTLDSRKFANRPNAKFVVTKIGRDAEDRQNQERAAVVI